jgi:hypothetical protein
VHTRRVLIECVAIDVLGVNLQPECLDERPDTRLVGPEPGGAKIDTGLTVADREQATPDTVASLENEDVPSRRHELSSGRETRDACTDHDHINA